MLECVLVCLCVIAVALTVVVVLLCAKLAFHLLGEILSM